MKRFKDRREAGAQLGAALPAYRDDPKVVVLALSRGGVVVGAELAKALKEPMDVFLVQKIGVPAYPELAMGALASGGVRVLNRALSQRLGISSEAIDPDPTNKKRLFQNSIQ